MTSLYDYTFRPWRLEGGRCIVAGEAEWDSLLYFAEGYAAEASMAEQYTGLRPDRPRVLVDCDPFAAWEGPLVGPSGDLVLINAEVQIWQAGHRPPDDDDWGAREYTMADICARLFALIDACPHLDFLMLTKRPENIRRMWPDRRENVWLLTSISDQQTADRNIPHLLQCRDLSPVRGVSCEPMLGPVDFAQACLQYVAANPTTKPQDRLPESMIDRDALVGVCLDWVIFGGESGGQARPCNVEWILSGVEQCRAAGVPAFVNQLGGHVIDHGATSATHFEPAQCWPDGTAVDYQTVRLKHPKGGDPDEWPEDLRVRELPE